MVFDFDLETKELKLQHETKINNYSYDNMICETIYVPTNEGIEIPVTLSRRVDSKPEDSPIVLNVYGAYGYNIDQYYRDINRPLWNRDWTVATVHVRGGGEQGEYWHQMGSKENKVRIRKCNRNDNDYLYVKCVHYITIII